MKRDRNGFVTLTREELYKQVWSKPMRNLAKEFGMSDVGLAKICRKHDIPRPPVGYWARRQHGKNVKDAPLPALETETQRDITIRCRSESDDEELSPETRQAIEAESRDENKIVVPDELISPFPIITKTLESLRKARPDEAGLVRPRRKRAVNISVAPASIDRTVRIMDALLKALERRSHILAPADARDTCVEVNGELVEFALVEATGREERELTPREQREKARCPWSYTRPLYRYYPSGRLSLRILTGGGGGARCRWSDGKRRRIENCLNAFVVSLLRISDGIKETRRREEQERLRRQEWERQRTEKIRLIHREEKRLEQLHAEVDAWHRSERVRAYARAVREAAVAKNGQVKQDSEVAQWLSWAIRQADRVDPLVESPPSILDERDKWEYGFGYGGNY